MNKQTLGALVALNLALLAALLVVGTPTQQANAQVFVRPQYAMIAGAVPGRIERAIYVVDLNHARVAAVIFRSSDNTFETVAEPQSMAGDLGQMP
jgi:hypothetical protein